MSLEKAVNHGDTAKNLGIDGFRSPPVGRFVNTTQLIVFRRLRCVAVV
ncbi:MAG: hypothetical protein QG590_761 [Pseudomonadota bacterium]|nr:hypothetical protein [Pseudomonadota bacterium]